MDMQGLADWLSKTSGTNGGSVTMYTGSGGVYLTAREARPDGDPDEEDGRVVFDGNIRSRDGVSPVPSVMAFLEDLDDALSADTENL